jgi:hemolysin III
MLRFREPVNGLTHLFAAIAALFGSIYLIAVGWGNTVKVVSLLVYGISLVLLFSASATYHLVKAEPKMLVRLRKFDHSAIYLLIAGTYTPICLNMLTGFWKFGLLGIIWGLALVGIGVKIFFIRAPRWLTAVVYVMMGWLSILGVKELIARLPGAALGWLLAGGIIYTLGAVIYSTKLFNFIPDRFGFHEVWHIFVILAALAHYILIAVYIAPV